MKQDSQMLAERFGTACVAGAVFLVWFLGMDLLGVETSHALLAWTVAAPFLLYPVLGRLIKAARQRAARDLELVASRRAQSAMSDAVEQMDIRLRVVLDACERLTTRCGTKELDYGRIVQEAGTIRKETERLREDLVGLAGVSTDPLVAAGQEEGGRLHAQRLEPRTHALSGGRSGRVAIPDR